MKTLNILQSIKSKYVTVAKMIPLTEKIRSTLFQPLVYNLVLSQGRVTRLAWRIKLTKLYLDFVLKYSAAHGSKSAVKWMKASLVALQKELGEDRLVNLQTLNSDLPYSRLQGGLPRIIPALERAKIRRGDVKTIRFWTGLFNLYRVLKVPGELKLSTITTPFTGSLLHLMEYISLVLGDRGKPLFFFDRLDKFKSIRELSLVPDGFVLSRSASPSNKVSASGILTDIWLLNTERPDLWQEILYYLHSVGTKPSSPFLKLLEEGYQLGIRVMGKGIKFNDRFSSDNDNPKIGLVSGLPYGKPSLPVKASIAGHGLGPGLGLSQFALKEEAAGKIRLFALMDSITQSVLSPLHKAMFSLLRLIPNDGTFDQEESIRRSQFKANQAGKAFSFDLTAATDRLPAVLTSLLIEVTFGRKDMAESWFNLMVNRPFAFNGQVAEKLKVEQGPYFYEVGQPMGGLSSWAGLALTHHWIVQLAAFRATGNLYSWNEEYEVLGDDLVIFNDKIADEYLKIMDHLGCEINLNKSIVSRRRPVFEFAKRTCWGVHIVSGISMAQVRAGWRVAGRVANALSFCNSGLITSPNLLAITLSRYAYSNGKYATSYVSMTHKGVRLFTLGILSLLGTLYQSGKLPLRVLMTALVNPKYSDADYSGEAVGLPLRASLNAAFSILENPENGSKVEFSNQEARDEVYKEYKSELSTIMLQSALKKAQLLSGNSELLVQQFSRSMIWLPIWIEYPDYAYSIRKTDKARVISDLNPKWDEFDADFKLLLIQIENYANNILGLEHAKVDPETLYDTIYDLAYKQAKWENITFEESQSWLERVEALEYKLTLQEKAEPGKTILESAPILGALRQMDPNKFIRPSYLDGPKFQSMYSLDNIFAATGDLDSD